jgi:hypothetical protein
MIQLCKDVIQLPWSLNDLPTINLLLTDQIQNSQKQAVHQPVPVSSPVKVLHLGLWSICTGPRRSSNGGHHETKMSLFSTHYGAGSHI